MDLEKNSEFRALTTDAGKSIRKLQRRVDDAELSNHLQILRDYGRDVSASQPMIDFYVKLAEPCSTGGVVVVLERPSRAERIRYGGGYDSVTSLTKTFRWLRRLVQLATSNVLGLEDVTVLDAFPFQPVDDVDHRADACDRRCSTLLIKLLTAKKPDMVISCFSAGRHQGVIRALQHRWIGQQTAAARSVRLAGSPCRFQLVDAFHPSFCFTYHPEERCLVDLLELQFAMAFGLWCETWYDFAWMIQVRQVAECRMAAIRADKQAEEEHTGTTEKQAEEELIGNMKSLKLHESPKTPFQPGRLVGNDPKLFVPQRLFDKASRFGASLSTSQQEPSPRTAKSIPF